MALHQEGRSGLILALCALVCGACGEASTSGPGSQMPNAGSSNSAGAPASTGGNSGPQNGGEPAIEGSAGMRAAGGGLSVGVAGAPGAAGSGGAAALATVPFVYVGSTNGQISIFKIDVALGTLTLVKSVSAGNYPSFVAFDPSFSHLYAVNESDGKVASFSVDAKTGDLAFLNRVDSGGGAPAHVSVDGSGKYVLVANYNGDTTRVFPIAANGSLGPPSDAKSPGINSHMILTDRANAFAFVINKGSDTVSQYAFDATKGTLTPNAVPALKTAAGAGPRHLAFHPSNKYAYLINELGDTLSAYAYDSALGQLSLIETKSTLPAGIDGSANTCAEVVVAPSGKFVYGSNRGHDSIVRFSIDEATGKLNFIDTTPSGGMVPRSFTLSRDGTLMLVANESGNVTSFSVDTKTGALTKLISLDVPQKPQFVGIAYLAAK